MKDSISLILNIMLPGEEAVETVYLSMIQASGSNHERWAKLKRYLEACLLRIDLPPLQSSDKVVMLICMSAYNS